MPHAGDLFRSGPISAVISSDRGGHVAKLGDHVTLFWTDYIIRAIVSACLLTSLTASACRSDGYPYRRRMRFTATLIFALHRSTPEFSGRELTNSAAISFSLSLSIAPHLGNPVQLTSNTDARRDVSTTGTKHSRLKSSMTFKMRNRRPQDSLSDTKSNNQRWFGPYGIAMGELVPRVPRRLRSWPYLTKENCSPDCAKAEIRNAMLLACCRNFCVLMVDRSVDANCVSFSKRLFQNK